MKLRLRKRWRVKPKQRIAEQRSASEIRNLKTFPHRFEPDDGEPVVGLIGRRKYKTLRKLVYYQEGLKPIKIPAGTTTDLASFPPPAMWAVGLIVLFVIRESLIWWLPGLWWWWTIPTVALAAAVVRWMIVLDPTDPKWRVAIVHDQGYRFHIAARFVIDAILRLGAVQDVVWIVDAWVAWAAVRLFGWRHWRG